MSECVYSTQNVLGTLGVGPLSTVVTILGPGMEGAGKDRPGLRSHASSSLAGLSSGIRYLRGNTCHTGNARCNVTVTEQLELSLTF